MAHLEKYSRGAMGHMFAHYDRKAPSSTSIIDTEKTCLNYNLAKQDQPLSQQDFIHRRLSEIKVLNRKDVNVFCDWVVTAPQNLSPDEYEEFFKETYNFLSKRYGKENTISAYVHMDESTPHIHYAFVPVAIDKKKKIPKLSAKEVITKKDLTTFHNDLTKHMTSIFGRDIGILNGATDLGNQTINQLRKRTKNLENFTVEPVKEVPKAVSIFLGKENVVISRDELEKVKKAVVDSALIMENAENIIKASSEQRQKTSRIYEKSEKLLSTAESRKNQQDARSAKLDKLEIDLNNQAKQNEADLQRNEEQCRILDERCIALNKREAELDERERYPYRRYRDRIQCLETELAKKGKEIDRMLDERDEIAEGIDLLKAQFIEQGEQYKRDRDNYESKLKIAVSENAKEYEKKLSEKDVMIEKLNNQIMTLKETLQQAVTALKRVCLAVATLAYGENNLCADLTARQKRFVDAITNVAAKQSESFGFNDEAKSMRKEYGISDEIEQELNRLDRKAHAHDEYSR